MLKKLVYILFFFFFSFECKAQDTQAQIDSIMTLFPNCTDYPTEVLIVLDSLLVALENEVDNEGNEEVDLLFFNYLSDNYPNMVVNGVINNEEASLITDLNLDGLGLNNIDGIEHFTNLESLSCKNNNLTSIPNLPNQLETLNLRSNNISYINPLPESLLYVDLRNNSLFTVPEFPNRIETLKLCFNNFSNIPNLPDSLRVLYFAYNNLVGLPTLPPLTEQVLCYNNQIEYFELIPESIEIFRVQNNNITILPNIPSGIQTLDVSNNPIVCVNNFPSHLEEELMVYPTCIEGCIDSIALNFDHSAQINNNSCEYNDAIVWPSSSEVINTGSNATYLLENVSFNGVYVSEPYILGAFYTNDFGGLSCGGFTQWNGGPSSISVYTNDETTNQKDGFDADDKIIWLAYDTLLNINYKASLNYISGSDLYAINAINLVSDYTIFNTPISVYGCTNEFASNYNASALLNDDSCVFPNNTELLDSIVFLMSIIDSISTTDSCESIFSLQTALEAWNFGISLVQGWNMFGFGCPESKDLTEVLSEYVDHVLIVKDNNGLAYLPEWNYNGIGVLSPGYGYQIKVSESIDDFRLCSWYFTDILGF